MVSVHYVHFIRFSKQCGVKDNIQLASVLEMERAAEIEAALGKQNVSLLINECMNGSINMQQMKDISIALHPRVHRKFKQRREEGKRCDFHELIRILDDWFIFELYEEEMRK